MDGKKLTPKYTGRFGDWDQKKVKKRASPTSSTLYTLREKKKI